MEKWFDMDGDEIEKILFFKWNRESTKGFFFFVKAEKCYLQYVLLRGG